MKTEHKAIAGSVGFGLLFWIIDAILATLFFHEGTLIGLLITDVPAHAVYTRCVVLAGSVVFGVLASSVLAKLERAEAAGALHKEASQEIDGKYMALYDNAPLPCQSLDEAGCFLDVNPAWLSTLGYERAEVIGKWFGDFLPPDSEPHFERHFPEFKRRGYAHDVHFRIRHKDGHHLDILFEGCIGYHADGSFERTYCAFQDITEQKRSEEALRESEENLRAILEASPDIIHLLDINGIILSSNKGFAGRLGLGIDDVVGTSVFDYGDNASIQRRKAAFEKVFRTGEPAQLEGKGLRGVFESHVHPVRNAEGEVTAVAVYARDITERKQAEEKEKEQRENLELLSETAMRFVEFPQDEDIYAFIGDQLQEFVGRDSYVVINSIDTDRNILTTRAVIGMGKLAERTAGLLGKHPVGMTYDAKDEDLVYLSDGKLHLYEEGLYGILLKTVPKTVCDSIERLLNIKRIHTIGLTNDNELFGTIVISLKEGAGELGNKRMIETFARQASLAVQRRQAEEKLQERMNELNAFYRATLGREGRVIELKQEVNGLLEQLGENKKYGDTG